MYQQVRVRCGTMSRRSRPCNSGAWEKNTSNGETSKYQLLGSPPRCCHALHHPRIAKTPSGLYERKVQGVQKKSQLTGQLWAAFRISLNAPVPTWLSFYGPKRQGGGVIALLSRLAWLILIFVFVFHNSDPK